MKFQYAEAVAINVRLVIEILYEAEKLVAAFEGREKMKDIVEEFQNSPAWDCRDCKEYESFEVG